MAKKKSCRLKIYLKSGNYIATGCEDYSFTRDNTTGEYIGYKINEPDIQFGINLKQIEAWEDITEQDNPIE